MMVNELFFFKTGSLPALENTEDGDVPLVYGTTHNNGIVKYVKVDNDNQIFYPPLITVSYLGTAFVQVVPFTTSVVDKSNIIILEPKNENMTLEEMYFYAFQINRVAKFGFHYGRRMNMRQLRKIDLEPYPDINIKIDFGKILPTPTVHQTISGTIPHFKEYPINVLFKLKRGDFHAIDKLDKGEVPTVSRTSFNNGIVGYYEPPEGTKIYQGGYLTVSTVSGEAFLQLDEFMATDNVVICIPKKPLQLTSLIFIQLMINRQKWRYSYGRQCYKTKFKRNTIFLPTKTDGSLNEEWMKKIVEDSEYWKYVKSNINQLN